MKFTASIINQLRSAPSVQDRIYPYYESVSLAEETTAGSPLDHGNGFPPFQHGSFDRLPSTNSTDISKDSEEVFYDALEQAEDVHLANEEKEK